MKCSVLFLTFCVIFNKAATEDTSPVTIVIQSSEASNTRWNQLIPALQTIKNTTNIKKERLHNTAKAIKHILTNETENAQFDLQGNVNAQLLREKINESLNQLSRDMTNRNDTKVISKEVNDKLNAIKDIIDSKHYVIDKDEIMKDITLNKTKFFSKTLHKIAAAISKVKQKNCSNETANIVKPNPNIAEDHMSKAKGTAQSKVNSNFRATEFTIPCQKASDILSETSHFAVPKKAICDLGNMNFIKRNLQSILKNLPPGKIVPNSVTCTDTGETVTMHFKPKTISLLQVYENLLRNVSITVLVPYHISKFSN